MPIEANLEALSPGPVAAHDVRALQEHQPRNEPRYEAGVLAVWAGCNIMGQGPGLVNILSL